MKKIYRSCLYVSGTRLDLFEKARRAGADAIAIDMEDSVPRHLKAKVRDDVFEFLQKDRSPGAILVKTNPLSTPFGRADVEALSQLRITGLRIPKVDTPAEVDELHAMLAKHRFPGTLELMIETAVGVQNMDVIAGRSPYANLLIMGEQDLANDLGCDRSEVGYCLSKLVIASKAANLAPPVMSVYQYLTNPAGLEESAIQGRKKGFWGRLCVHPDQVEIINRVFTPTQAEVERAREVLEIFREAEKDNRTAFKDKDGTYLSMWAKNHAERVLAIFGALLVNEEHRAAG